MSEAGNGQVALLRTGENLIAAQNKHGAWYIGTGKRLLSEPNAWTEMLVRTNERGSL